jgi:predicted CxxxxCH...CXXCH cytochrome family protein
MQNLRIATLAIAAVLVGAGCGSAKEAGGKTATVTIPGAGPGGADLTVTVAACTGCHGDLGRSTANADPLVQIAPPVAPSGNAADPAIGAHLAHLTDGPLAKALPCSSCHVVPASAGAHQQPVVVFSGLATTSLPGSPTTVPSFAGGSCSATYCHGRFPNGEAANAPAWTGAPAQCGSCHGVPPTPTAAGHYHPQNPDCNACHAGYSATAVVAATHVDGAVQLVGLTCTTCHGDPNRAGNDAGTPPQALAPAPPLDSTGQSGAAVGAHLIHLVSPAFSKPVNCEECHNGAIPTSMAHADGTVQVVFGPIAKTILPADFRPPFTPSFDGTSCSTSYCHGNFSNGAGANPIVWTSTGTAACGSCHGLPPTGTHPVVTGLACDVCHPMSAANPVNPDPTKHVNGVIDFQ